ILSGPDRVSTSLDRVAGCQRALDEAGIDAEGRLVLSGEFTQNSGYNMAIEALAVTPPPTALFAANNFIAIGALRAIRDSGLRVPEDLSLVGFDDLPPTLVTFPFLTVASQPAYEMGQKATELLLNRLNKNISGDYQEIVLPTELIVRQSSGPARL
ncbi:MAG TPA: substrate-binding domain-containing protein, partial [Anaerolineales bacterium]